MTRSQLSPLRLLAGISAVSFSTLLLELAATRLFSVILFYHFAFLAISLALLGLGAGGVYAHLRQDRLARFSTRVLAARLCALNAVVIVAVLETVIHPPVSIILTLTVIYWVTAVPFFLTGLLFSVVYAREAGRIGQLYGADLGGGALACLAVVPLLNLVGGPNAILIAAMGMAAASAIWAEGRRGPAVGMALAVLLAALVAANHSGKLIDVVYAKGLRRDQSWVEFVRWNAISRVEVDHSRNAKHIVIDADASTDIMNTDPHHWSPEWERDLMSAAPAAANLLRPRGDFAIIGPGGGVDVLRAVGSGSKNVTAIEINPIIANTIMRERYADYAYHLYDIPEVHLHVADGRSWIRNSRDKYDVIQMTLVDTWASTVAGAFALSENNLYTVEAFQEYFDHLKPDGFLAITRWEFEEPREALRVVSQAMETLRRAGVREPSTHFMVVSDEPLDEDGATVLVLVKASPFTGTEVSTVRGFLDANPKLQSLYLPGQGTPIAATDALPRDARAFAALIAAPNDVYKEIVPGDPGLERSPRDRLIEGYAYNIAPVTDNAPFFFFTMKTWDALRHYFGNSDRAIDWKNNLGVLALALVLLISLGAVLAFLVLPLVLVRGPGAWPLLYFVAVGLGYILVEIAFIQRFVLFLGHPTYALTVVVFLLLLSSGAGSLTARRWLKEPRQVRWVLAAITAGLAGLVVLLPHVLGAWIGLPFPAKLAVSAGLLVPVGFAMGMPFPTGLRQLAARGQGGVEWAWAMNAAASVLGSALAMAIAIHLGIAATLASGAAAYLAAAALALAWRSVPAPQP